MRGGGGGKVLPSDYSLQPIPEFESASKATHIITQEHTSTIENMITLCVLGEYSDDVIFRALPGVGLRRREEYAAGVNA